MTGVPTNEHPSCRGLGSAAIFSWLIAGVMILLIGLTYAELGPMFPISGGVVRYPHIV
jgi:amino acid transporter